MDGRLVVMMELMKKPTSYDKRNATLLRREAAAV